jgi:hypothetical protein
VKLVRPIPIVVSTEHEFGFHFVEQVSAHADGGGLSTASESRLFTVVHGCFEAAETCHPLPCFHFFLRSSSVEDFIAYVPARYWDKNRHEGYVAPEFPSGRSAETCHCKSAPLYTMSETVRPRAWRPILGDWMAVPSSLRWKGERRDGLLVGAARPVGSSDCAGGIVGQLATWPTPRYLKCRRLRAPTTACSRKPYAPMAIVKLTKRTPPRNRQAAAHGRGAAQRELRPGAVQGWP